MIENEGAIELKERIEQKRKVARTHRNIIDMEPVSSIRVSLGGGRCLSVVPGVSRGLVLLVYRSCLF